MHGGGGLIKQVKRIYETMDEDKPRTKRGRLNALRREWLRKLAQYRKHW